LPDALVQLEGVAKVYATHAGTVEALRATDATVRRGSLTAVAGVSGSGKSTLLRLVAGLERPTSGRLVVDGTELGSLRSAVLRRYRRDHVAFVAQNPAANLLPHLTLAEQAEQPDAAAILERFGLGHRQGALPTHLSGGELARVSIALALARSTTLFVADEPTAELDEETAGHVITAIAEKCAVGLTAIVATHDASVLARADHVLNLEQDLPAAAPAGATHPHRGGDGPIVRVAGLSKAFSTTQAVVDATFELGGSELSVVTGRSGSGKSTLLMLLGGWQRPDAGVVDTDLSSRWNDIAYVPQRFGLVRELTIRDNDELPTRLGDRLDLQEETGALLEALGLVELADRYPQETSIGQQQRAALARGLAARPPLLLADEPTSHQDPLWRERIWALLRTAADRGTACFVATHEPHASAYAHAVWEINDGRVASSTRGRPGA
jgi:ABC-type lipoprotein export system ATPase subunit